MTNNLCLNVIQSYLSKGGEGLSFAYFSLQGEEIGTKWLKIGLEPPCSADKYSLCMHFFSLFIHFFLHHLISENKKTIHITLQQLSNRLTLVSPLLQDKIIFLISFSFGLPSPPLPSYIITGGTLSRYDAPRWTKPSLVPCIKQIVRGTLSHPGDLDEDE